MSFLKYKRLKLKLRVFLAGHSVAMVTIAIHRMTRPFLSKSGVMEKTEDLKTATQTL